MDSLKNKYLYLSYRFFGSPLEALYTLLIFILTKELNASMLQLTVLAASKPVVSLVSFQINSVILGKPKRIKPYLITLSTLGALPSLFFFYIDNPWFYIASYSLSIICIRGANPAWLEMLKIDIGQQAIGQTFSYGSAINYTFVALVPFALSSLMDTHPGIWKLLFAGLSLFQLINVMVIRAVKIPAIIPYPRTTHYWKEGWKIIVTDRAFLHYQLLFFLGGVGLVMLQPVLPVYFKETLNLSYTQLTLAFSICKGIGFVSSAYVWPRLAPRLISIYILNAGVNIFCCLFIGFIVASSGNLQWLYVAYLMYGALQAGCELTFNLSGPTFAGEKESTLYSSINLVFIGIRGCICPFLGQFLFAQSNALGVFFICGSISVTSVFYAFYLERNRKNTLIEKKVFALDYA